MRKVIGYGIIVLVLGFVALAWAAKVDYQDKPLRACETMIKAGLKAPSTYTRIHVERESEYVFVFDYDAENSFGVPLRARSSCVIGGDGIPQVFRR